MLSIVQQSFSMYKTKLIVGNIENKACSELTMAVNRIFYI